MKMLKNLVVTSMAVFLSVQSVSASDLTAEEAAFAFGNISSKSSYAPALSNMSKSEMEKTEGEWGPASVWGAAVGAGIYWASTPRNQRSWRGAGTAAALGAATGGLSALGLRGASMAAGRWGTARGIGVQGNGWRLAYHGPHHNFRGIGRQPHFQLNRWTPGVRGNGSVRRLPW